MLNKFFLIFALVSSPSFGTNPEFFVKSPFGLGKNSAPIQDFDFLDWFDTTLNHTFDTTLNHTEKQSCPQNCPQSDSDRQSDQKQLRMLGRTKLPDLSELQLADLQYSDHDNIDASEKEEENRSEEKIEFSNSLYKSLGQYEPHKPKTKQILKSIKLGENSEHLQQSKSVFSFGFEFALPDPQIDQPQVAKQNIDDEQEHKIEIIDLANLPKQEYNWKEEIDDLVNGYSTSESSTPTPEISKQQDDSKIINNMPTPEIQTFFLKWKIINNDPIQHVIAKFFKEIGSPSLLSVQEFLLKLEPAFQIENLKRKILSSSKLTTENEQLKLEILSAIKPYAMGLYDKESARTEILSELQKIFDQIRETQLQEEMDLIKNSKILHHEVLNKLVELKKRKLYSFYISINTESGPKVIASCSWGLQRCPSISKPDKNLQTIMENYQ